MLSYDILEISDELIKSEAIKEVTSSKLFLQGIDPDPEGLASYDIFGTPGTEARKKRYGYINLNCTIVHPHVHNVLKELQRLFDDVIYGYEKAYIKDGKLIKAVEGEPTSGEVGTGVMFLKRNWNRLSFETSGSKGSRFNNLRFMKTMTEGQIFLNKLLVLPAYYRDVDMRAGAKKNEIEGFYVRLINLASALTTNTDLFALMDDGVSDVHRNIMKTVTELYDLVIKMFAGRKGFIHKFIMGKTVDYSARLVISGPNSLQSKRPEDMDTHFDTSLVPLHVVAKCFAPFMINRIREIIIDYMGGGDYVMHYDNGKNNYNVFSRFNSAAVSAIKKEEAAFRVQHVELASDWKSVLSSKNIEKLIELYHESQEHRLDVFRLPTADGGDIGMYMYVTDVDENVPYSMEDPTEAHGGHMVPLRLIHLFYLAAYKIVKDKHVLVTRFPIQDQNNTYPSKINIMAYKRTKRVIVGETLYEKFPIVEYETDMKKISAMFTDSLTLCAAYLESLGGDYDGDQVSLIPLFTRESNEAAGKFINSKSNLCNLSGGSTKGLQKIYQQAIFALTS